MVQVAKRGASVLKRRKSRNRMETAGASGSAATGGPSTSSQLGNNSNDGPPPRSESDGDVVFYAEEPRASEYTLPYIIFKLIILAKRTFQSIHLC